VAGRDDRLTQRRTSVQRPCAAERRSSTVGAVVSLRLPLRLRAVPALAVLLACLALPAMAGAARCNGDERLCGKRFDRVVLAGAHNAMAARDLGFAAPNQRVGIDRQLRLGIRAFLIDVYYGQPTLDGKVTKSAVPVEGGRLYLCHVICENGALPLADALAQMSAFLDAQPGNVLQLIVQDAVAPADLAAEVEASGLGPRLFRGTPGPRWPTLRQMIASRQQVVVLAEERADGVPWYHRAYDGIVQETPYSFATPDLLTSASKRRASCRPHRGGRKGSLFLMNHWSPPFAPTVADARRVNATAAIVGRARACRRARGRMPTTIAADMVDVGGLVTAVRRLNAELSAR
jgi:hypothetical protein